MKETNLLQEPQTKKPKFNSSFQRLMSVHWWMAGLYLILFMGGTFMSRLPRSEFRGMLYDFHKSIAVVTIILLVWRVATLIQVLLKKYRSRLPKLSNQWVKSFVLHTFIYGFMVGVPITGFFFSNSFRANNVSLFGLVLPDIFPENKDLVQIGRSLHFWLAYTFLALISLHLTSQWKVAKANWRRLVGFIHVNRRSE
jgi:cytochrome b561